MALPFWREAGNSISELLTPKKTEPPPATPPVPGGQGRTNILTSLIPPVMNIPGYVPQGQQPTTVSQERNVTANPQVVDTEANKQWWQENVTVPVQAATERVTQSGQGNYVPVPTIDQTKVGEGLTQMSEGIGRTLATLGQSVQGLIPPPSLKEVAEKAEPIASGGKQLAEAVLPTVGAIATNIGETPVGGKTGTAVIESVNLVGGAMEKADIAAAEVAAALPAVVATYSWAVKEGKSLAEAGDLATQAGDIFSRKFGAGRLAGNLAWQVLKGQGPQPGETGSRAGTPRLTPEVENTIKRMIQLADEGKTPQEIEQTMYDEGLASPLVEAIFRTIISPWNLVGVGAAERRAGKFTKLSSAHFAEIDSRAATVIKAELAAGKFQRPLPLAGRITEMISPRQRAAVASALYEDAGDVLRSFRMSAEDPQVFNQVVRAMVLMGGDADEVAEAQRILGVAQRTLGSEFGVDVAKSTEEALVNLGNIPLSTAGKETTIVLRESLMDEAGKIDFKMFEKIVKKSKTTDEGVLALQKHYVDTIAKLTGTEWTGGSFRSKGFLEMNPVKRAIDKVYSGLATYGYLGYSPAFVARNVMYDGMLSLIDGNTAFWSIGSAGKFADDFGFISGRAFAGIGAGGYGKQASIADWRALKLGNVWERVKAGGLGGGPMLRIAGEAESMRGFMVWAAGTKRAWTKYWQYGTAIPYSVALERAPTRVRQWVLGEVTGIKDARDVIRIQRNVDAATYLADNLLDPVRMGRLEEFTGGLAEEFRVAVKGVDPETAAVNMRKVFDRYDGFTDRALGVPASYTGDIEAIDDINTAIGAVGEEGARSLGQEISDARLRRDLSRKMVESLVADTGTPETRAIINAVSDESSARRVATYQLSDNLYFQRKEGKISYADEQLQKAEAWAKYGNEHNEAWNKALEQVGEQDRRAFDIKRFEDERISDATYTKVKADDVWRRMFNGDISPEGAVNEVNDLWRKHNEFSVRGYDTLWQEFSGDPIKGPLELVGFTPREMTVNEWRIVVSLKANEAGISGVVLRKDGKWVTNKRLLNTINKDRRLAGLEPVKSLNELDVDGLKRALQSFEARKPGAPKPIAGEATTSTAEDAVRHIEDSVRNKEGIMPHRAAINAENKMRAEPIVNELITQMQQYAATPVEKLSVAQANEIKAWLEQLKPRLSEAKLTASRAGILERDFVLHNYDDRRLHDSLLSYAFIFSFWPTRTLANWGRRFANNPALLADYYRLMKAQEQANKGLPEWAKYTFHIGTGDNAMYFNFNQVLNPLWNAVNGFHERARGEKQIQDIQRKMSTETDPVILAALERQMGVYRRGLVIEGLGNMGVGSVNPIAEAVHALSILAMGDKQGALATFGYLTQPTRLLKYASAALGVGPKGGITAEPWLWNSPETPFQGGDYYERARVVNAMYKRVLNHEIPFEDFYDAAYSGKGDIYEQGMQDATASRAGGVIASGVLGVGFRPYTAVDMRISQMDDGWYNIVGNWDAYTDEQRSELMNAFSLEYPEHVAVRMSRKWGNEKDEAMMWVALQRIPPGSAIGATAKESAIINDKLLSQWYDTGTFEGWPESEKMILLGGILKAAEMYKIPDIPTQTEWNEVRQRKAALDKQMATQFPEYEAMNAEYFRKADQSQEAARAYINDNPSLGEAWDYQRDQMLNDPLMMGYYGKPDAAEQQATDWLKQHLTAKYMQYAEDPFAVYQQYLDAPEDARAAIASENEWLYDFMSEYATGKGMIRVTPPTADAVVPKGAEARQPVTGVETPIVQVEPVGVMPKVNNPNVEKWRVDIEKNATVAGIDPRIVATVIQIESGGDPYAMGKDYDTGLMQIVSQESGYSWAQNRPTQTDLFDPAANVAFGTTMLAALISKNGGDVRKALAEYNSGSPDVNGEKAARYLAAYDKAWQSLWGDAAAAAPTGDYFARMEGAMGDPLRWEYKNGTQASLFQQARSTMFDYLHEQYPGAAEDWDEYYTLKESGGDYKAFLKTRPYMTEYSDRKTAMQTWMKENPLMPGGGEETLAQYMAELLSQRGESQLIWSRDAKYVRQPPPTGRGRRAYKYGGKEHVHDKFPVEEDFARWWEWWKASHRGKGETFWLWDQR
jgi:hypothetical protein